MGLEYRIKCTASQIDVISTYDFSCETDVQLKHGRRMPLCQSKQATVSQLDLLTETSCE